MYRTLIVILMIVDVALSAISADSVVPPDANALSASENISLTVHKNKKKPSKFEWGFLAGAELFPTEGIFTMVVNSKIPYGFCGGLNMRYLWHDRWYLRTGLLACYDTSAVDLLIRREHIPGREFHEYRINRSAVQLPLCAGYKFGISDGVAMSVCLGVRESFGIGGSIFTSNKNLPEYHLYGDDGVWSRWGTAVTLGLTLEGPGRVSLGLDANIGVSQYARQDIFRNSMMRESEVRLYLNFRIGK